MDMEVSSLKKKFKDKKFAAGCSRDVIKQGAEQLGWTLEELMEKTILAMRSCENSVQVEINLGVAHRRTLVSPWRKNCLTDQQKRSIIHIKLSQKTDTLI